MRKRGHPLFDCRTRTRAAELSKFFDRYEGFDLLDRGIVEIDPDRADLDRMRREASQP